MSGSHWTTPSRRRSVSVWHDTYSEEHRFPTISPRPNHLGNARDGSRGRGLDNRPRFSTLGVPWKSANREQLGSRVKTERGDGSRDHAHPLQAQRFRGDSRERPSRPDGMQSGAHPIRGNDNRVASDNHTAPTSLPPKPTFYRDKLAAEKAISTLCTWQDSLSDKFAQSMIQELATQAADEAVFRSPGRSDDTSIWSRLADFRRRLNRGGASPDCIRAVEEATESKGKVVMAVSLGEAVADAAELTTLLEALCEGLVKRNAPLPIWSVASLSPQEALPLSPLSMDGSASACGRNKRKAPPPLDTSRSAGSREGTEPPSSRSSVPDGLAGREQATKDLPAQTKGDLVSYYYRELNGQRLHNGTTGPARSAIERFAKGQDLFLWHASWAQAALSDDGMNKSSLTLHEWAEYEKKSRQLWSDLGKDKRRHWSQLRARVKKNDHEPLDADFGAKTLRTQGLFEASKLCSASKPQQSSAATSAATSSRPSKPGGLPRFPPRKRRRASSDAGTSWDVDEESG